jgi:serine/threonine-protein kinase
MRPPARPSHDILVHNGRVLFVDERGRFVAVDAAKGGEPLWFVPSQGITIGEPVASGRFVFLALARGEVLMIDAIDGGIAERVQCGASLAVGPVEAGGTVVVGTDDGRVLALRMGNGQLLWEHRLPASAVADRLVLVQESILVRTNDHRLVSLDLRDGTLAAATQVVGRIVSGPVVGDDRVVIVTRGLDAAEDVLRAHRLVDLELA